MKSKVALEKNYFLSIFSHGVITLNYLKTRLWPRLHD